VLARENGAINELCFYSLEHGTATALS